jgi:RimJ/RimL family protein N-acetyltransferase
MTDTTEKTHKLETHGYIVRKAVPADSFKLADYLTIILRDRMASIADADEMKLDGLAQHDYLTRLKDNAHAIAMVAECNGEVIGFLTCEGGKRRKVRHTAEVGMSVRSDWRRRGVAAAMVRATERWARGTGVIRKLTLNVFEHNYAAIELYTKLGFEIEGTLRGQIMLDGKYQDLHLMGKFLNNEEEAETSGE